MLDGIFNQLTPIAAVSDRPGWIDLFAVGMDAGVYTAWYHGDAGPWLGWSLVNLPVVG